GIWGGCSPFTARRPAPPSGGRSGGGSASLRRCTAYWSTRAWPTGDIGLSSARMRVIASSSGSRRIWHYQSGSTPPVAELRSVQALVAPVTRGLRSALPAEVLAPRRREVGGSH